MTYISIGYSATLVIMVASLVFKDKRKQKEKEKYFDDNTAKFLMWILLSVIVSFGISMSADIPDAAELGGLIWIFGPFISGAISAWIYILVLMISIKLKVYAGWACIIFNLATGIYLFFSA
jgi:hypothetical protein